MSGLWRGGRAGIQRARECKIERGVFSSPRGINGARRYLNTHPFGRRFLSVKHMREFVPNYPI